MEDRWVFEDERLSGKKISGAHKEVENSWRNYGSEFS
jgi:hypothetical protein